MPSWRVSSNRVGSRPLACLDVLRRGLTLELRTCGKRNPDTSTPWCWCMTDFPERGHGPYWYAYWREPESGRRRSRYIGKRLKPAA